MQDLLLFKIMLAAIFLFQGIDHAPMKLVGQSSSVIDVVAFKVSDNDEHPVYKVKLTGGKSNIRSFSISTIDNGLYIIRVNTEVPFEIDMAPYFIEYHQANGAGKPKLLLNGDALDPLLIVQNDKTITITGAKDRSPHLMINR